MHSISLTDWGNFFVASAGAAAGLAGLLFVALSINLARILNIPGLAARAGETFIPLAATLIISLLALVPDQAIGIFGGDLICIGGIAWVTSTVIQFRAIRARHYVKVWHLFMRLSVNQPGNISVLIAGFSLVFKFPGGLLWLVPAVVLAFTGAMLNSWILLVEILR